MFLILYRKKNNNIYKSSTGLCNVCVVHDFHPRCAWLFFLSFLWSVTLSNIEQHPLSVTLKNYKLALLVGKKKRNRKCWSFLCVFLKPFPREKADKSSFFDVSVFSFSSWLMWVGRRKEDLFSLFVFLYIVNGGIGKRGE